MFHIILLLAIGDYIVCPINKAIIDSLYAHRIHISSIRGDTAIVSGDTSIFTELHLNVKPLIIPKAPYHTFEEVEFILDSLSQLYPEITQIETIGYSLHNRPILCLEIGVKSTYLKPRIRLGSTIHGNEPPGTELLLMLADSLLTGYYADPSITEIIDSSFICIVPILNPDGFVAGTRYNANGVDLNRNFPVPDSSIGADNTFSLEPETEAIINWANAKSFSTGLTFHTGAALVNCLWDYTTDLPPDSELIINIGKGYAYFNPAMTWVGYGAEWYIATGTLQDWAYAYTGAIDYTIELCNEFAPDTTYLDSIWEQNKEAIIYFLKRSIWGGINLTITDIENNSPLEAKVNIHSRMHFYTDPTYGFFHRPLLPGTYTLTIQKEGYLDTTITITLTDTVNIAVEIALIPKSPKLLLSASPSINQGTFKITINLEPARDISLIITDIAGRCILTESLEDISTLEKYYHLDVPSGRYFVLLKNSIGRVIANYPIVVLH